MSEDYTWERWPQAEALVERHLERFLDGHGAARALAAETEERASVRLFDLLDHIVLSGDTAVVAALHAAGFEEEAVDAPAGCGVYGHPGAQLPRVAVRRVGDHGEPRVESIGVKVESIDDFLLARGLQAPIAGSLLGPYRTAAIWPEGEEGAEGERRVVLVERRGYRGFVPQERPADYAQTYLTARERWATRQRVTDDEGQGMAATVRRARELAAMVGRDTAAWIAFEVERDYWQRRNGAAQAQRARQDRLGLGWANHDHHTFRSSRAHFAALIATLEELGFVCRERFYAGSEAGWGAQVLEQAACGLVVFADVDLRPDETDLDFAHRALPQEDRLGTVGLWCALHGESLLGAGMHHLEAQFAFERLRDDLAVMGVGMMKPFSNFHHLRQAFTRGERWRVAPARLERLRAAGRITPEQYQTFLSEGAIGSHLENLQRRDGFKGFNQHNVSTIIRATDPREALSSRQ